MKAYKNKGIGDYIIYDRGNPLKYLYDSLDSYFQVSKNIAFENVNINDIMAMRIWAANDVVNVAFGVGLINKEKFNEELKTLLEDNKDQVVSGISKLDTLSNEIKNSAVKIQIIIKYLNEKTDKKTELQA
ncbi:MAG TPA: hypothetical protein PKN54_02330 [Candidatus Cloacimonas acidaminovorans]|nr:hypothetical protein [Candidatus Cloacimonas acidaminovorans]